MKTVNIKAIVTQDGTTIFQLFDYSGNNFLGYLTIPSTEQFSKDKVKNAVKKCKDLYDINATVAPLYVPPKKDKKNEWSGDIKACNFDASDVD